MNARQWLFLIFTILAMITTFGLLGTAYLAEAQGLRETVHICWNGLIFIPFVYIVGMLILLFD